MESTWVVRGEVVLPQVTLPAEAAELVVQVEDVSRADAPSIVVGEQRLLGVQLYGGAVLPFEIEVPAGLVDERHSYSVRAHVDISGSGEVDVGDLVSTQSYPVLTRGYGDEAVVEVRLV
ncbi:MAG: YbaY family lipoprotein [Actinobacteria bacterium]|nr:YbaY family lipoprotein [Actinomycetota bacterium]